MPIEHAQGAVQAREDLIIRDLAEPIADVIGYTRHVRTGWNVRKWQYNGILKSLESIRNE